MYIDNRVYFIFMMEYALFLVGSENKKMKIKFKVKYLNDVKEIMYECYEDALVKDAFEYIGKILTDNRLKLIVDGDNIPGVYFIKNGILMLQ